MSTASSFPDRLRAASVFREEAARRGFARVGFARAAEPPRFERFRHWIGSGRQAGMTYLERTADLRSHPDRLLPGARSIVCLAAPHEARPLVAQDGSRVARYVGGAEDRADYHGTLRGKALALAQSVAQRLDQPMHFRVCVDSTPLAERSFAAAAGLGWIGKNGCVIDKDLGSYFLLAEILTDLDLPADDPVAELCGSCDRCLKACPTQAFVEPGLLDAGRCLAYWTIEHRGALPDDIKEHLGQQVFGCDICQEVCPWNAPLSQGGPAQETRRPALPTLPTLPSRADWLSMGPGRWRREFGATAMNRAGRRALQRNAAASAAAVGDRACATLLERPARGGDAGLADAAAWAAARFQAGKDS